MVLEYEGREKMGVVNLHKRERSGFVGSFGYRGDL